jgi:uncharacterized protein (DUF342 family)
MEAVECQITNTNTNTSTNENANAMDLVQLNTVRESIENMSKFNQVEVLRILTKHKEVTINENKYGIHINLSELNNSILDELLVYIKYVNTQEIDLNNIEKQKQDYKNIYFLKDNKDNSSNSINNKYVTDFRS